MPKDKLKKDGTPSFQGMGGGRPKAFESEKQLEELIEEYFRSCHIPVMSKRVTKEAQEKLDSGELQSDDLKPEHKEPYQMLNENGELLFTQIEPYTTTGLCIALDIDRETLLNYGKDDKFFGTVKRAKLVIHNYAEKELFRQKNVVGVIFNLKNNHGWQDKQERDITTGGEKINVNIDMG